MKSYKVTTNRVFHGMERWKFVVRLLKYYFEIILSTSQLLIPLLINYLCQSVFKSINMSFDDSRVFRRVNRIVLIPSISRTDRSKLWKCSENIGDFPHILDCPRCFSMKTHLPQDQLLGCVQKYSNSIHGYRRNCHGCYWQNPIISST